MHDLEVSLQELSQQRELLKTEKLPLSAKLSELEARLSDVRKEYQQTARLLDTRSLDLSNLQSKIVARQQESQYIAGLLVEYVRNFEARLHITEMERYEDPLEAAKLAPENSNLTEQEVFQVQANLLNVSLDRFEDSLGGSRFEGWAVDSRGLLQKGTIVLVGPAAIFASNNGRIIGAAETRLGSLEPAVIPFGDPLDEDAAYDLVESGAGFFPLDPTLGNAHLVESTEETLVEHIQKGGLVMIPILVMAGLALLVALYKWIALLFTPKPSMKRIGPLLDAVGQRDEAKIHELARKVRGPVGRMLTAGVEHLREPQELIEEVMYETVLTTKLKLQSLLPFIAICAASAPLLGLLGTVTGIITTFKLITVFGSGDVKSLSGGISVALITTEFGLIVAIPSLLIHAFLSRKGKNITDNMEKAALAFINQVVRTRTANRSSGERATNDYELPQSDVGVEDEEVRDLVRKQVGEILQDLLGPKTAAGREELTAARHP
jgi:biopolymer transport protein ExbB